MWRAVAFAAPGESAETAGDALNGSAGAGLLCTGGAPRGDTLDSNSINATHPETLRKSLGSMVTSNAG